MDRQAGKLPPASFYEAYPEGFHIYSWCPTPEPTVPATQVHMHIPFAGTRLIVRFKGPYPLDELIRALQEHRRDVWGEP